MTLTTIKLKNILFTNYDKKKIYVMYYSGGGSLYHPLIHSELGEDISGYIFDSSPVPFKQNVFSNWIYHKFGSFTKHLVWGLACVPMWLFFNSRVSNPLLSMYNQHILNTKQYSKTLFITSKSDPLVPVHHIGEIVKQQHSDLLLLEDSGHLEHDVIYPSVYRNKLDEFLA